MKRSSCQRGTLHSFHSAPGSSQRLLIALAAAWLLPHLCPPAFAQCPNPPDGFVPPKPNCSSPWEQTDETIAYLWGGRPDIRDLFIRPGQYLHIPNRDPLIFWSDEPQVIMPVSRATDRDYDIYWETSSDNYGADDALVAICPTNQTLYIIETSAFACATPDYVQYIGVARGDYCLSFYAEPETQLPRQFRYFHYQTILELLAQNHSRPTPGVALSEIFASTVYNVQYPSHVCSQGLEPLHYNEYPLNVVLLPYTNPLGNNQACPDAPRVRFYGFYVRPTLPEPQRSRDWVRVVRDPDNNGFRIERTRYEADLDNNLQPPGPRPDSEFYGQAPQYPALTQPIWDYGDDVFVGRQNAPPPNRFGASGEWANGAGRPRFWNNDPDPEELPRPRYELPRDLRGGSDLFPEGRTMSGLPLPTQSEIQNFSWSRVELVQDGAANRKRLPAGSVFFVFAWKDKNLVFPVSLANFRLDLPDQPRTQGATDSLEAPDVGPVVRVAQPNVLPESTPDLSANLGEGF